MRYLVFINKPRELNHDYNEHYSERFKALRITTSQPWLNSLQLSKLLINNDLTWSPIDHKIIDKNSKEEIGFILAR